MGLSKWFNAIFRFGKQSGAKPNPVTHATIPETVVDGAESMKVFQFVLFLDAKNYILLLMKVLQPFNSCWAQAYQYVFCLFSFSENSCDGTATATERICYGSSL